MFLALFLLKSCLNCIASEASEKKREKFSVWGIKNRKSRQVRPPTLDPLVVYMYNVRITYLSFCTLDGVVESFPYEIPSVIVCILYPSDFLRSFYTMAKGSHRLNVQ